MAPGGSSTTASPEFTVAEVGTALEDGTTVFSPLLRFPPEPKITSAILMEETNELVRRGRVDCDAIVLGAGFLGGAGGPAVAAWALYSACMWAILAVGIAGKWYRDGVAAYWLYVLLGFIGLMTGLRAYLLVQKRFRAAYIMVVAFLLGIGPLLLVQGILFGTTLKGRLGIAIALGIISPWMFASGVNLYLMRFAAASDCLCVGFAFIALIIIDAPTSPVHIGMAVLFPTAAVGFYRILQRRRAQAARIVAEDARKYEDLWAVLSADEANAPALERLALLQKTVVREPEGPERPERKVVRAVRAIHDLTANSTGTRAPRQRIGQLSILFYQAHILNEHFQEVVRLWAEQHNGCRTKPALVKRRARAIEKLHRSYHGDATRCIDLVRSSISCPTLQDVCACVETIAADPRVAILQMKNHFDPRFDALNLAAGYRKVSLSLVLVDDFTAHNGVAEHVTELQIGLDAFTALVQEGGHARYVQWRNMRAA